MLSRAVEGRDAVRTLAEWPGPEAKSDRSRVSLYFFFRPLVVRQLNLFEKYKERGEKQPGSGLRRHVRGGRVREDDAGRVARQQMSRCVRRAFFPYALEVATRE